MTKSTLTEYFESRCIKTTKLIFFAHVHIFVARTRSCLNNSLIGQHDISRGVKTNKKTKFSKMTIRDKILLQLV